MYAQEVYDKANEMLHDDMTNGTYIHDEEPLYYIYELIMDGRSQTGIVAVVSVDDYIDGTIKKHENTLAAKDITVMLRQVLYSWLIEIERLSIL